MHTSEFLTPYQRSLPPWHSHEAADLSDLVSNSRRWGEAFGAALYDHLDGEALSYDKGDQFYGNGPTHFPAWAELQLHPARNALFKRRDDEAIALDSELNFVALANATVTAWTGLFGDMRELPDAKWNRGLSIAQDAIAYSGLKHYAMRHKLSGKEAAYEYYNPENKEWRYYQEGRTCEYDAAIVLLELMKKDRDLIILAAPPQFERYAKKSPNGTSNNADFVAIRGDSAIGLQVKTYVTDEIIKEYDRTRIMLIDGESDLGDMRYVRTRHTRSTPDKVAWTGLISAERVLKIPTKGPNADLFHRDRAKVMQAKYAAKLMLAGSKAFFAEAVERVGRRLNTRLSPSDSEQQTA